MSLLGRLQAVEDRLAKVEAELFGDSPQLPESRGGAEALLSPIEVPNNGFKRSNQVTYCIRVLPHTFHKNKGYVPRYYAGIDELGSRWTDDASKALCFTNKDAADKSLLEEVSDRPTGFRPPRVVGVNQLVKLR